MLEYYPIVPKLTVTNLVSYLIEPKNAFIWGRIHDRSKELLENALKRKTASPPKSSNWKKCICGMITFDSRHSLPNLYFNLSVQ